MSKMQTVASYFALVLLIELFGSCNTVNQLRYFKNLPDSSVVNLPHLDQEPRTIQEGDKLQITIGAKNPEAAAVFNTYGDMPTSGAGGRNSNMGGGSSSGGDLMGYWVDENGQIEFPIIGKVDAYGLTALQLKDKITERVSPYLRDPLVNVRFISFKFTVLGEVRSPGTFTISLQRTTLLDALGAAGDLPRSAKRYNIQLYRDYNGKRTISRIDLRDKALLTNKDLFQIKHNDVIIVQPRDARLFSDEARFYVTLGTLLLSTATLVFGIIIRNN